MRINKTFVDKVELPLPKEGKASQAFYRDSAIPGFGLRVTSGGAKSFIVEKRINGKVKRKTLGKYGELTVEQARKAAQQFIGKVATGTDPIAENKEAQIKGVTLQEAFDDYLTARKDLKPSTVHDYKRAILISLDDWLNKPMMDISKDMVEIRHQKLGQSSPARADNTMRVLKAVFNHARSKYEDAKGNPVLVINPVDRLGQTRAWYKVDKREDYIKPHQLRDWYQATLNLQNETTRDYLHLILLTGLRRTEASTLKWADIDFEDKTLTIHETKNHQTHVLPFSDFLEGLLTRRFEYKENAYVFPSKSKRGYLVEPRTAVDRVCEQSGVKFRLHDLRRTFITIGESLDIPGYALKKLMNHKDPNDVTAGYIISDVNRLRKPMQKITDFIVKSMQ